MRRKRFLAAAGAALALPALPAAAQSDADPAVSAPSQSLRVLLGPGEATPAAQGFLYEGRPYRGSFSRLPDGSVVNLVDLESYLYSVVPREMAPAWPDAAMEAQAICARTYVLQRSTPRRDYDLRPSEADQVYGGIDAESPAAIAAVDATAGSVLRYRGGFASVAYSSCCGGHTEASSEAWGVAPIAYLMGVSCPWCSGSPNYRWTASIDFAAIEAAFAAQLAPLGELQSLAIASTDPSGRARAFELRAPAGSAFVRGSAFRLGIGARVLRSLLIQKMTQANASAVIEGGGLGHGVGMCQWGARGMALAGRTANDILAFYFPGTQIGHD
ncbi:MAG TPA: SpoIID/LytB domain-containing protein [Verrucomicrobiae bacterium]|nr:SpoIID/LytB domain-containing protein [Verrucomicrobiae bacterium]